MRVTISLWSIGNRPVLQQLSYYCPSPLLVDSLAVYPVATLRAGHAPGQRRETRMLQYRQLIFAIAIDKTGIDEEFEGNAPSVD